MERFGKPGETLLGSDSHTSAAGSLGMLAIGAGGIEVALALMGEPFYLRMPEIFGVKLTGELPAWVSAKDVILEMLRRHGVKGGDRPDHRILRPRPGRPFGHGPPRDRQHGRRTGRDDQRVPFGRAHVALLCAGADEEDWTDALGGRRCPVRRRTRRSTCPPRSR